MMAEGKVVQHHFTIVDGWTFRQLRLGLAQESGLKQTLPGKDETSIASELGPWQTRSRKAGFFPRPMPG